jgi:hypothetical protein
MYGGEVMTVKDFIAVCVLSATLVSPGSAQVAANSAKNDEHPARNFDRLVRDAHTPKQYQALGNYYDRQQKQFMQQAAEAKVKWEQRSQNTVGVLAKYPRPVDSAKYLYEYYVRKAAEAGSLAQKYRQLAEPSDAELPQKQIYAKSDSVEQPAGERFTL